MLFKSKYMHYHDCGKQRNTPADGYGLSNPFGTDEEE